MSNFNLLDVIATDIFSGDLYDIAYSNIVLIILLFVVEIFVASMLINRYVIKKNITKRENEIDEQFFMQNVQPQQTQSPEADAQNNTEQGDQNTWQ